MKSQSAHANFTTKRPSRFDSRGLRLSIGLVAMRHTAEVDPMTIARSMLPDHEPEVQSRSSSPCLTITQGHFVSQSAAIRISDIACPSYFTFPHPPATRKIFALACWAPSPNDSIPRQCLATDIGIGKKGAGGWGGVVQLGQRARRDGNGVRVIHLRPVRHVYRLRARARAVSKRATMPGCWVVSPVAEGFQSLLVVRR